MGDRIGSSALEGEWGGQGHQCWGGSECEKCQRWEDEALLVPVPAAFPSWTRQQLSDSRARTDHVNKSPEPRAETLPSRSDWTCEPGMRTTL